MSMLKQNTKKKGQVDKKIAKQLEFEAGSNNKKYKVEGICKSAVYARELKASYLLGLYYLISCKDYSKDENTQESTLIVQHLLKLVSTFQKNYSNKLIATFLPINLAPPMAKRTTLPNINSKQKCGQPIGSVRKKAKHQLAAY